MLIFNHHIGKGLMAELVAYHLANRREKRERDSKEAWLKADIAC